ncbi:6-carboxytetrahydropterin synthase QueD [Candidatus Dependentiae bacterium]|nr:6-carboxytetrahydropterin synthase QueD [Candidatus Dependentiae bacterium]
MYEITIEDRFSSAHQLRDYEGKCENLHGHNWIVKVSIRGNSLDDKGMLIDFKVLKKILNKILEELDHKFLNEVPPFDKLNPTAENIANYIYFKVEESLNSPELEVSRVKIWESENSYAVFSKDT